MDSYSKSYWEKCDINVTAKPMRSGKVLEQSYGLCRLSHGRAELWKNENRKVYDFGSESRDINVTLLYK